MPLLCTFMVNWISILTYTLQWELHNLSLKCKLRICIRSKNNNSYKKSSLAARFFISAPLFGINYKQ